ncbi:MAG: stage 0 sporulation family protein [Bacillota bacterium]|jgi:cell fate regulator YaaT (PSP1 superfamily)|nr:stage 0 sporulation family protein [Bacillota bacterium]HHU44011.1 stage 0 sporulation family protein [Clostridiales bacterium]
MAIVVGVKFKNIGKTYYFSPKDIEFKEGDGVITETVRGVEYGTVVMANKIVDDSEIVQPLKEIIRKASEEDTKRHLENLQQRKELVKIVNEKVKKHGLAMKIVDAEYTFDRNKIIVYFTAEGRIDFRELVKDLASVYHLRIELRQIYERDDIKMRGALGPCGRPCCCATHLQDFEKVSIKMAKIQGLSLNPTKISGCCGKLMCCLKYENDYYKETYSKMPKVNSTVITPDGEGTVLSNDILRLQTKVKINLEDGTADIKTYPLEKINAHQTQKEEDDEE